MIKAFRQRENTDGSEKVALAIASVGAAVETIARLGMGAPTSFREPLASEH